MSKMYRGICREQRKAANRRIAELEEILAQRHRKADKQAERIAELEATIAEQKRLVEAAAIKHLATSGDGQWVSVPRWFVDALLEKNDE